MLPRLQDVEQNAPAQAHTRPTHEVRAYEVIVPLTIGLVIAMVPVPAGLSLNAWRYFALFATVIVALITEPIPPAIIGMAGVIVAAMLGPVPALLGFDHVEGPQEWFIRVSVFAGIGALIGSPRVPRRR